MHHAFFVHFFAVTSGLRRESAYAEDVNATQQLSFSFFLFSTVFLEFNSRKICQHLTNWTSSFTLSVTEREKTEVQSNSISTQSSSAHVEERDQARSKHWGREWVEHNEVMKHCACFVTNKDRIYLSLLFIRLCFVNYSLHCETAYH